MPPKQHDDLFGDIASFSALHAAAKRAIKGKRRKRIPAAFMAGLEREMLKLERELQTGTYRPGAYVAIHVEDPKPRTVSAAPFRDRAIFRDGPFDPAREPFFRDGPSGPKREPVRSPLATASTAAAPGTTIRGTSVRRTATGTNPTTGTTISGSGFPVRPRPARTAASTDASGAHKGVQDRP